ncbi:GTP cyclohydrolase II RibA [Roseomonas harenae]|uniref:GTP cyclohydrolase II RibA n=1 Tax=Muricoccus harenae TaxID=2692566 RepID=UPI00133175E2
MPEASICAPAAGVPGRKATGLAPDPRAAGMRAVHRAVSDLRRGTPVILSAGGESLVLAAAETVGARGLAELAEASLAAPVLLLSAPRAAAILSRPVSTASAAEPAPVSLRLSPALLAPDSLRRLADPVAEQLLPEVPQIVPAAGFVQALSPAAITLAKIGRLLPALVVAPASEPVAARLGLLSVEVPDVLAYPVSAAASLNQVAEARVPLEDAPEARIVAFRAADGGIEHLAILVGQPEAAGPAAPLCRIHSECFTGDLLGSLRCDCGPQLRGAIARMAQEPGGGVLLYLAQEGRGIGLVNKLRAYTLQDTGLDTLDANRALGYGADERDFRVAATMLEALDIPRIRLLTNNPDKLAGLAACGIQVEGRVSHLFAANGVNDGYLATKKARFGHLMG